MFGQLLPIYHRFQTPFQENSGESIFVDEERISVYRDWVPACRVKGRLSRLHVRNYQEGMTSFKYCGNQQTCFINDEITTPLGHIGERKHQTDRLKRQIPTSVKVILAQIHASISCFVHP
jgi:hypothetical protein